MGKGDSRNPRTFVPHEQWWFHNTLCLLNFSKFSQETRIARPTPLQITKHLKFKRKRSFQEIIILKMTCVWLSGIEQISELLES
jgi:hypothetical protein